MDISALKSRVDLHDLAQRLGLERPHGRGNYRAPHREDKNPSLGIKGERWRDYASGEGGSCIDLVLYCRPEIADAAEAMRFLHELYGFPAEPRETPQREERTLAEWIAQRCLQSTGLAKAYLIEERGLPEEIVNLAIRRRCVGYNDYTKPDRQPGEPLYGGPAVAFLVRSLNPGHVVAVDTRYFDPALNGGVKTQCLGDKDGHPWFSDLAELQRARTVYVCESPINALTIEAAHLPHSAALAVRGVQNVELIDWRFLQGKHVVAVMDWDQPDAAGRCAGQEASWRLLERLVPLNVAALPIDQTGWTAEGWNDINDVLRAGGQEELRIRLKRLDSWAIPGMPGNIDLYPGRPRVFLPSHDARQYWRFRTEADFTKWVKGEKKTDDGDSIPEWGDVCGFRIAALSRVSVASAASVMSGDRDTSPRDLFAVSVQAPRHGPKLLRRVMDDDQLHNLERWRKFGPVYSPIAFQRLVNILERGAHLGEREAVNFVGLCWRDGRVVVNEGPDCYFQDPEKQCPYHAMTFPSGTAQDGRRVVQAYARTFGGNAALLLLLWALGGHLKAFLGFWPHMMLQARKGAGKSTLIKRLERTIAFTMFSGQSIQTEYRLLTSISHTSHPVGWEEISARRQDVIDKAQSLLQENYQYTITRRGSEMTEYLVCAPVLLAGEDVPTRSIIGKLVRTDLAIKGELLAEDLPRFPVLQWLQYLARLPKRQVQEEYEANRARCLAKSRASGRDDGATRMAWNYAALLTAWRYLADFVGLSFDYGNLEQDLMATMNAHVEETSADREPWVWILEIVLSEMERGDYRYPWMVERVENDRGDAAECLLVRLRHVMDHIAHTPSLRDKWNGLTIKSDRVLRRQLQDAEIGGIPVIWREGVERTVYEHKGKRRMPHLTALSVEALASYGLHVSVLEQTEEYPRAYG